MRKYTVSHPTCRQISDDAFQNYTEIAVFDDSTTLAEIRAWALKGYVKPEEGVLFPVQLKELEAKS